MGSEYSSAGGTLTVFMIGLPLSIITEIFYYYEYALGRKKSLLKLGLVGNILRVVLYILLVPIMGQIGASVEYLIGSTVQLSYSLILARRYSFHLANKDYFILTIIPYLVGFIVWLVNAHVILSSIIIIVVPFILYIRFHFISDHESNKIMSVLLPSKIAKKIAPVVSKIIKTLR